MASIEKRSENTYRITVSCGYDSKGKKLRECKTVTLREGLTERQKEKELNRLAVLFEREVESGTFLDGETITLAEFSRKWLEDYAEKSLAPGTYRQYKSRLEKRIIPALGHIRLSKLQPHHLLSFYNNLGEGGIRMDTLYKPTPALVEALSSLPLRATGISPKTVIRLKKGKSTSPVVAQKLSEYFGWDFSKGFTISEESREGQLSSKTIKHHHDLVSAVLSAAVEWNLIPSNPAMRVRAPKVVKSEVVYYDDEQVMDMFAALELEPLAMKALVYFTVDTGLRVGEVAGAMWNDINLSEKSVKVFRQRQYVTGYGVFEKNPKTDSGVRTITLSSTVVDLLQKYKQEQDENRIKLGTAWIESGNVFVHWNGAALFPHRPYMWFVEFLERHNLPHITFHGLRHTNASLLIAEGIDIVTLSGRLGHADKNVTLRTYSHVIKSKEREAANKMENIYAKYIKPNTENED